MAAHTYTDLLEHVGHHLVIGRYGLNGEPPWVSVDIECEDCNTVLYEPTIEDWIDESEEENE